MTKTIKYIIGIIKIINKLNTIKGICITTLLVIIKILARELKNHFYFKIESKMVSKSLVLRQLIIKKLTKIEDNQ